MFHYIKSERGKDHILYQGYKFGPVAKQNKDGSLRYVCLNSKLKSTQTKCYAAILIAKEQITNTTLNPVHNHEAHNSETNEQKLQFEVNLINSRHNYKKRCRSECTPVHKIFNQEINKVISQAGVEINEIITKIPEFRQLRASGYAQRWKQLGKLPKTTDQINLTNELDLTIDKQKFLLH
jgi:hypothetical protein